MIRILGLRTNARVDCDPLNLPAQECAELRTGQGMQFHWEVGNFRPNARGFGRLDDFFQRSMSGSLNVFEQSASNQPEILWDDGYVVSQNLWIQGMQFVVVEKHMSAVWLIQSAK